MRDEIPEVPAHWEPNSHGDSRLGPVVTTLLVLTAAGWLLLGCNGATYLDARSTAQQEGTALVSSQFVMFALSVVMVPLTLVTAAVTASYGSTTGKRWALVTAGTAAVLGLALCGYWSVVII
ncbi:hypothetical protein ACFO1B_35690 [Dactylosporangium siamense]|uniref:Uncharacterized protein n=1 Tax=Dactylosporangium siamense TaxID=685454 RepID=A0A919PPH5_9ACTN|nr:hypothetical protein [Dactylosporangium siamense]GIG45918.1 hypothetical protein Dsi01nite_039590 [Dactylosporangium siamense]